MARLLLRIIDGLIFVVCIPFYLVVVPFLLLYQFAIPRIRTIRIGQEITHWPYPDVRDDLRVIDTSRLREGLIGVQRRTWNALHSRGQKAPEFGLATEYVTLSEFWFGNAYLSSITRKSVSKKFRS